MNNLDLAARLALARIDSDKNYLFGCVAMRNDGAIVTSTNILTKFPNGTAHAEYRCMRKAGYNATLWVARITRDGRWANARPCPLCHALLKNRHVNKVYYTIAENEFGVIKF